MELRGFPDEAAVEKYMTLSFSVNSSKLIAVVRFKVYQELISISLVNSY